MRKIQSTISSKVSVVVITEIFLGLVVSTAALIVFFKLAFNIPTIHILDVMVSELVYSWRNPLLNQAMIVISYLGQEILLLIFGIVWMTLIIRKYYRDAFLLAVTIITGGIINVLIKEIIRRDRPTVDPLFQEILHSFPSLHAMNSFVFYSLLVLILYKIARKRQLTILVFMVCSIIVILVGISRIYLGAHYLSDVVAGYVIGLWWVATVLVIDKTLSIMRRRK